MARKIEGETAQSVSRLNSLPEVIRLVVLMYVRFPLSLRNVEDLLFERGIDLCHETVRFWWNRFGDVHRRHPPAAGQSNALRHWRWHLDEMYIKINGEMVYPWRSAILGATKIRANLVAPNLAPKSSGKKRI